MSLVVAYADIKPDQVTRTRPGTSTAFFRASGERADEPSAFVSRHDAGTWSGAHFHEVDQFQILVDGKGKFGRHSVAPYCIHFSRAYTPYGPLQPDKDVGFAFMVLRSRYDPGAQYFPDSVPRLKRIKDRRPWQITTPVDFPVSRTGVTVRDVPQIKDDQGLFVCAVAMPPGTRTATPDPSTGDGQFVMVTKGSLITDGKEHNALTVAFIRPTEGAFQIEAGAQGLEALIMNLPQVKPHAPDVKPASSRVGFRKWHCALCSFAYDEAVGMPDEGIPAGTRWQDVPDNWSCPDCSAAKSDFQMVEV